MMELSTLIIVIVAMVLGTLVQEEWVQDTNLSELTNWFEITPPLNNHLKVTSEMKERAQRKFTSGPINLLSSEPLAKSPSLQLIGSDTSDTRFLEKETLRYSVMDLSTQSSAKLSSSKEELDCGAVQTGYSITFTYCHGDLIVVTMVGTQRMTCREIEQRYFFGPVMLKSNKCTQSFVFDRPCEGKLNAGYSSSTCPELTITSMMVLQWVLPLIIILILVIVILVLLKLQTGLITTEGRIPLTKRGKTYYADYFEWYDGSGQKRTGVHQDESKINIVERRFKISMTKLILLALLFRPITVDSYEIIGSFDSTLMKYSYILDLVDQEIINLGQVSIVRSPVAHTAQLTRMFETSSWSIHHQEEYFCQWYKCEAYSVCGFTTLPFIKSGELAQSLFKYENKNNGYYTCQKLNHHCEFGSGCKLISIEVIPDNSTMFTMYSISRGGSHGGELRVPPGCVVENAQDNSNGELQDYYLLSDNKKSHHLCNSELFSMKPEGGMLGDIQIGEGGNVNFTIVQ